MVRENENTIEDALEYIQRSLKYLSRQCFICLGLLSRKFRQMRTCGAEICEFRFEEIDLGNVFKEIKDDPAIAHF